ncbi:MAG: aldehyde ferredoxin oxidoreductase family protein, partial [Anaerolineales bacterium]
MSPFHRLLRIDLTEQSFRQEEIPTEIERAFVGGKGLGTAYLLTEVEADTDALDPGNKLFFCPGALVGTLAPAACRYELVTVSPLTGLYLDCNSGGHYATALKASGHDMVVVEGAASSPTVVHIHDSQVDFLDAGGLWGRSIYETEMTLRERLGQPGLRVASIGIAGENLVRFACIANDFSRQAARGGPGAVMGSKKLKAIAVSGTHAVPIAHPAEFISAVDQALCQIAENPWVEGKRAHGTVGSLEPMFAVGAVPTRNFTASEAPDMPNLALEEFEDRFAMRFACAMCPLSCSKGYRMLGDSSSGQGIEGPEYETVSMLGPNCDLYDPDAIAEANYLCNQLGLDTISAGATIGLVLQALDDGLLSPAQLEWPEPSLSRAQQVAVLLEAIAERRGIGDLLAEGALRAAQALGLEKLAPHVKGMELPAYDPRVSEGMALAFMTSDRGACHLRTWPLGRELSGELPRSGTACKVDFVVQQQNDKAAEECLGVCQFPYGIGLLTEDLPRLLSAVTGQVWDRPGLRTVGERIWNLSRVFNVRRGVSRRDDYLPERFSTEAPLQGPLAGRRVPRQLQDQMLDEYYALRGWSSHGIPRPSRLAQLGLGCIAAMPARLQMCY